MTDVPSTSADRQAHWDERYSTIGASKVSWHEPVPAMLLRVLDSVGVTADESVIDVGGGASRLAEVLLDRGFGDLTVLDVSGAALSEARSRVGDRPEVSWVQADLLLWQPDRTWTVWHDRAVFHFLTDPADRATYRELLHEAVEPGGVIIVGTFAADGPQSCSGLPVRRYSQAGLASELGADLVPLYSGSDVHHPPSGGTQPFTWVALRR
jgi:hypothetical protein